MLSLIYTARFAIYLDNGIVGVNSEHWTVNSDFYVGCWLFVDERIEQNWFVFIFYSFHFHFFEIVGMAF